MAKKSAHMMSVQTITGSASEAGAYLRAGKDVERYYTGEKKETEIENGVYFGGHSFGLHGKVVGEELNHLLDGRAPDGSALSTRVHQARRVGFDMTFSPDKSFGLLWARLDETNRQKIEDVLRHSVEDTLAYTQENVLDTCVRRGHAGAVTEAAKDLTFALFMHGTSREQDPQPHVHSVLMNVAQRQDGSYGALNEKAIFQRQSEIRRVFNLTLAARLRSEMGIEIESHKDGVRIAGVSRELCDAYSKRTHQIRDALDELGMTPHQAGKFAVLQTRVKKGEVHERDLLPVWQKGFDEAGFSEGKGLALLGRSNLAALTPEQDRSLRDACVASLGESTQNLTETQIRSLVAEKYAGSISLGELESKVAQLKSDERIVTVTLERGGHVYTTQEALDLEKKAVSIGKELGEREGHAVEAWLQKDILDKYSKKGMSDEQRLATEHILKPLDLSMMVGAAGTGKSYSLQAAREVLEASGYTVRGMAPTGKAAQNLEESSRIQSKTVDKFLYDLEKGKDKLTARDVVVVDESAMLGNDKTRNLLEAVKDSGAKIILVGDDKQLAPIARGRPFEHLKEAVGAAEIATVRRQKHEWQRDAAGKIREGDVRGAIVDYHERGLVHHGSTWAKVRDVLVDDWIKDRKERPYDTQLVLASTREKVEGLNRAIRDRLVAEGELSLKREAKIGAVQSDGVIVPKGFTEKDRIYFTKNDENLGVKNGSLGTVEKITREKRGVFEFSVKMDDGAHVLFRSDKYASIAHGYATTVHKSQGDTVDRSYILPERMMDRSAAYVAFSRHREEARVYASTELVHGYVREFEIEKATEAKAKLHIDRIEKNIKAGDKVSEREREQVPLSMPPAREEKTFVTGKHLSSAENLTSKSRAEVTQALYDIATEPKGVEHRYSAFDGKVAEFQREAAKILKAQIYEPERLFALAETIKTVPEGKAPILTDQDREAHYQRVHESVADRERGFVVGKEMETRYLTQDQRELLQEVATPGVPEHRVEALRDLALAPPSVGTEHGKSADPWHINRQAMELLKGYEPEKVQAWAKETLRQEYPEGAALERAHKESYVEIINDRAGRVLEGLQKEREQERGTAFAAPEHKECGRILLSEASLEEKVVALRELVRVPRAAGPEFGEVGEGPASWQRVAARMAHDAEKGNFPDAKQLGRQLENLGNALEQVPLGVRQQGENEIPFERGFERLQEHGASMDLAQEREQAKALEQARSQSIEKSRSRGRGMGM
jgi:conjugative relaxase-like TrwC/TraI family protein